MQRQAFAGLAALLLMNESLAAQPAEQAASSHHIALRGNDKSPPEDEEGDVELQISLPWPAHFNSARVGRLRQALSASPEWPPRFRMHFEISIWTTRDILPWVSPMGVLDEDRLLPPWFPFSTPASFARPWPGFPPPPFAVGFAAPIEPPRLLRSVSLSPFPLPIPQSAIAPAADQAAPWAPTGFSAPRLSGPWPAPAAAPGVGSSTLSSRSVW